MTLADRIEAFRERMMSSLRFQRDLVREREREIQQLRDELDESRTSRANTKNTLNNCINDFTARLTEMEKHFDRFFAVIAHEPLRSTEHRRNVIENRRVINRYRDSQDEQYDPEDQMVIVDSDSSEDEGIVADHPDPETIQLKREIQTQERRIQGLKEEKNRIQVELSHVHSVLAINRQISPKINDNKIRCPICLEENDVNGEIGFKVGYSYSIGIKPVCGHMICGSCAPKMSGSCHVCRKPIRGYQRIYFN